MTKILKRPGTTAEKRALGKSAGRMARNIFRMPKSMAPTALKSYSDGKPKEMRDKITKEIAKKLIRRKNLVKRTMENYEMLLEQNQRLAEGMKLAGERFAVDSNAKAYLTRLRDSTRIIIGNERLIIGKLEMLERHQPRAGARQTRQTIGKFERAIEKKETRLARLEERLKKMDLEGEEGV